MPMYRSRDTSNTPQSAGSMRSWPFILTASYVSCPLICTQIADSLGPSRNCRGSLAQLLCLLGHASVTCRIPTTGVQRSHTCVTLRFLSALHQFHWRSTAENSPGLKKLFTGLCYSFDALPGLTRTFSFHSYAHHVTFVLYKSTLSFHSTYSSISTHFRRGRQNTINTDTPVLTKTCTPWRICRGWSARRCPSTFTCREKAEKLRTYIDVSCFQHDRPRRHAHSRPAGRKTNDCAPLS